MLVSGPECVGNHCHRSVLRECASGFVIVLAVIALQCLGCSSGPQRGVEGRGTPFFGISPEEVVSDGITGAVERRIITNEGLIEIARRAAAESGREWPVCCALLLKSDSVGDHEVFISPLTVDNLKASGIKLEAVEWIFLYGTTRERVVDSSEDTRRW